MLYDLLQNFTLIKKKTICLVLRSKIDYTKSMEEAHKLSLAINAALATHDKKVRPNAGGRKTPKRGEGYLSRIGAQVARSCVGEIACYPPGLLAFKQCLPALGKRQR